MVEGFPARAAVGVHQHERGTGDLVERAPTLGDPLDQGGFAAAQVRRKGRPGRRTGAACQARSHPPGLLGAAAGKFKRVRIEDRHS